MPNEYLFATDEYNKPKVLAEKDAVATLFLRLLLLKPGDNPMHPEMGVDIKGRWCYCLEKDLDQLESEISVQINTFLPDYKSSEVSCSLESSVLVISITYDDTLFTYSAKGNISSETQYSDTIKNSIPLYGDE